MVVMLLEWVFTSAFLILVVLALRAAFGKRVSARLRYALWLVVLARLLVPVQLFTSPLAGTRIFSESRVEQNAVDFPSAPTVPNVPDNVLSPGGQDGQDGPAADPGNFPQAPALPALPDAPEPPAAPDLTKSSAWLGWTWLAGSAAMALVLLASNLQFFRRLRRARVPLDGADCPLPVYIAAGLPSPCLFGLARPAVYVTPETAADPVMLRHVIAHEYTHARHGDHIWNVLRAMALAAHWWNPLVWLAVCLSRRDCEMACDEGALKRLGDGERAAYGNTLLALITAKPQPGNLLMCATTMTGSKKSLKERIARIALAPRRWLWAAAAVVLATALACACAFGSAEEPKDEPEPDPTPAPTAGSDLDLELAWDGWELRNTETLAAAPDLNRNGIPETVVVGDVCSPEDAEFYSYGKGAGIIEGGELLWTGWGSNVHAGGDSFLLYDQGGEDYLMEFNIYGQQGQAHGDYRIFTLENGGETTVRENHVAFDYCTDSLASVKNNFDPQAVAAFVDEVDGLLERCTLLVDTGFNYRGNPPEQVQVDLRWLENYAAGYSWLDGQTTLENLVRFKLAAEHPAFTRDLNGDMLTETVYITRTDDGLGMRVELWDHNGNMIWSDEGDSAHAGWNAVFLCTLNGKDYLLRYHPNMGQGWCNYGYELFTLTRDGKEKVVRENRVIFDINFGLMHESFDPDAIAAFMDEINGLLANSVQLINTDDNLLNTFQKEGRLYDDLWWLDHFPGSFVRDGNQSLLENLRRFQIEMTPS